MEKLETHIHMYYTEDNSDNGLYDHMSIAYKVLHGISIEICTLSSLRWRHNERDSVSNHQQYDCLHNRLFRRRSKKISKLCVTDLCVRKSPGTGEFPAQMASNEAMLPFDDVIKVAEEDAWMCFH